jgi:flavin reductase (DIM6/NTAB) family NADH-FMN oxidoreductase RutF
MEMSAGLAGCAAGALGMWAMLRVPGGGVARRALASSMRLEGKVSPQEGWRPAQAQPPPYARTTPPRTVSMAPRDLRSPYSFGVSAVVPRPIAFVSTVDADGVRNLAPFSYFGLMGHEPLTVAFAPCAQRSGRDKDTLANIRDGDGECVVHVISDWFVEAANHTCGSWAPEQDEFELSGLTPLPSVAVAPPRVAEAAVALECKLQQLVPVVDEATGKLGSTICLMTVVQVHVHEEAFNAETGTVVAEALRPISRLGGNTYGQTRENFDILRPGAEGAARAKAMRFG